MLILRNAKLFFKVSKAPFARGKDIKNNQTYFNFILQKVRDFFISFSFFFFVSFVCKHKDDLQNKDSHKGEHEMETDAFKR